MGNTPLDRTHAAMEAEPEDNRRRLRFYERLADAELFLLLSGEQTGDAISPKVFPLEHGPTVMVFDREERLAAFAEGAAPYAELTGRTLAPLLAEAGFGLGLNLGVARSAFLMASDSVMWLAKTLATRPRVVSERPVSLTPPTGLSEAILSALEAKLPAIEGLAGQVMLATAAYADGRTAPILAFTGARDGAEAALAAAAGEALAFSGEDEGALDVLILSADDAVRNRLERVALQLDLPGQKTRLGQSAPGMDPDRPPRLR